MEGVAHLFDFTDTKQHGKAALYKFTVDKAASDFTKLRAIINNRPFDYCPQGDYIKLYVGNTLMMSDTKMERDTNFEFVYQAKGDVFIAGLGIGLIIHNLKDKIKKGIVKSITVIEISQDVIDLVSEYFKDIEIKYICGDVLEYKPKKDEFYDTIFFDIWPLISSDNLSEMSILHRRFARHKRAGGWMGSWCQNECRKLRRDENR